MARKILVTGATGFIGSHCIVDLLEHGYQVRGTVRDLARTDSLKKIIGGAVSSAVRDDLANRLEFSVASLVKRGGWEEAMAGCDAVFHVASPVPLVAPTDAQEVIRPAVDGTMYVLRAARAAGVMRVVMTSSVAAVSGTSSRSTTNFDASDWSDVSSATISPYSASKTLAEKEAWAFAERHPEMSLTTVNPALVLGPALEADYGSSLETLVKLLSGSLPMVPRLGFEIVDVRDVAALHRLALEQPSSVGQRLLCANGFRWFLDLANHLRSEVPEPYKKKLPRRVLPNVLVRVFALFVKELVDFIPNIGKTISYDNAPALAIGWQPRTPEEAALAGALSLIKLEVV